MIENPINVSLHGHGLPDFGPWWKKKLGYSSGENTARIIVDACLNAGLGIYALTDDEFGNDGRSRFEQVRSAAEILQGTRDVRYEFGKLGGNAFIVGRNDQDIVFLDGQSIEVIDLDPSTENLRKYELLTFGASGIEGGHSFTDTFKYLSDRGLPTIAEHPLAHGHHGPMNPYLLENLCDDGKFTAVEHNAKVAVPNWLGWIPHDMINGHVVERNYAAARIAEANDTPLIANDDADFPSQIGSAYTIFPRDSVGLIDGERIKNSLVELITEEQFETHTGDIGLFGFINYGQKILRSERAERNGSKKAYDEKHSPTVY